MNDNKLSRQLKFVYLCLNMHEQISEVIICEATNGISGGDWVIILIFH